jgi:hypothetical protein
VFTGRRGGDSAGQFSSLNLAFHVGDDDKTVIRNREKFFAALGLDCKRAVCAEQVHGTQVVLAGNTDAGKGAMSFETSIKGADGLVTDQVQLPLALFFADCVPVILVDKKKRIIAVAHAGWRGIYGYIVNNAVKTLNALRSTQAKSLLAFIGPSIGGCCYQVSADLLGKFSARFGAYGNWLIEDRIDLRALAANQLAEAGLQTHNIYTCGSCCTSCENKEFFSYRADGGKTGRHAAIAAIL